MFPRWVDANDLIARSANGGPRLLSGETVHYLASIAHELYHLFDERSDQSDAIVDRAIAELFDSEVSVKELPIGFIGQTVSLGELPSWALECNGSTHDRDQYPDLWEILPSSLKVTGQTFRTPILNGGAELGRYLRGANGTDGTYPGDYGGQFDGKITINWDNLPAHDHQIFGFPGIVTVGAGVPESVMASSPVPVQRTAVNATPNTPIDINPAHFFVRFFIVAL